MNGKTVISVTLLFVLFLGTSVLTTTAGLSDRRPAQASPIATAISPLPSPQLGLRDVAEEARLVVHFAPSVQFDTTAPPMMGGGLCWLDYDQDGWLDLYVVATYTDPDYEQADELLTRNTLFHNESDGTFVDVSSDSGADLFMRGTGCVAGDIDGNGFPDIYVSADGPNALLMNQGLATVQPQFIDVAADAGVNDPEWNTGAAMADVDNDGRLDLFVGAYLDPVTATDDNNATSAQDSLGLSDHLYRNTGVSNGRPIFEEITHQAGFAAEEPTLGARFNDVDSDGYLDLYVVNDGRPDRLYHNQGDGAFVDASINDPALYEDVLSQMLTSGGVRDRTGRGTIWLDLDQDGYLDLITAQMKTPLSTVTGKDQPIFVYHNYDDISYIDVSRTAGLQSVGPLLAGAMAAADYDNDGLMDLAISPLGSPLILLKASVSEGNWLLVDLPAFVPGARLKATLPDDRILERELTNASSMGSSADPRFHLGLGEASEIARLTLDLPGGQQLVYENVTANQIFHIPEADLSTPAIVPMLEVQNTTFPVDTTPSSFGSVAEYSGAFAREWMQLIYDRVQADRISPPAAARLFAYTGVTLYEALLPGMPGYRSLQGQLNGMPVLPQPSSGIYNWPAVASSALATVANGLFETDTSRAAAMALRRQKLAALQTTGIAEDVLARSRVHGERLGQVILAWAWTDGYLLIRDRAYTLPVGSGVWVPTSAANEGRPLEPYWSELRPFALTSADVCAPTDPVPYSSEPNSTFYTQVEAVYNASQFLTTEQSEIALFWADNPGETSTPPGHWIAIAIQIMAAEDLALDRTAEVHALLGVVLADAFISCWQEKYQSMLVRPVTYIQEYIDPTWQTLVTTPPFPEYTSGHSVASAAAAVILTSQFGAMPFTDATHVSRGLPTRRYESFNEAAEEAAISRLYGGIHYPMAIENGMDQGRCIGNTILDRVHTH